MKDDFRIGDRIDLGLAVAHRFGDPIALSGWSVYGELLGVILTKGEEDGVANDSSGGSIACFAPGLRYRFESGMAMSVAPSIPLAQDWNGQQIETDLEVAFSISAGG